MGALLCFLSIGIAAAAGLAARWWFSEPGDSVDPRSIGLHEYEIAYLAGATPRAVGAAVASLALRHLVEFDAETKTIRAVGEIPGMAHPFERAVHAAATPGDRIDAIGKGCDDATAPLRQRLESNGLVLSQESSLGLRFLTACVYLAVLAAAWALDGGRGLGGGVTVVFGLSVGVALVASRPFRTRRGGAVLRQLTISSAALKETAYCGAGVMSGSDMGLAVGLFGPSILAGGPLSELPRVLERERGSWGSGGGCGGCGSCGGCGGCGGCA